MMAWSLTRGKELEHCRKTIELQRAAIEAHKRMPLVADNNTLRAENAELREALRRMHHWVSVDLHDCGEDDCELCIDMARARTLLEEK